MKGCKPQEIAVSLFAGYGIVCDVSLPAPPYHLAIKKQLIGLNAFTMKMFYHGIRFGMGAAMIVSPKAAGSLVQEGFGSKESLFQWFKDNTFETEKPEQTEWSSISSWSAVRSMRISRAIYTTSPPPPSIAGGK
jgi:hypothetical protein